MNIVKVIALLIIGAIFGYSFSFIGKAYNEENLTSTAVIPLEILPSDKVSTLKETPSAHRQAVVQEQPVEMKNQNVTKSLDEYSLNKEHLDLVQKYKALKKRHFKAQTKIMKLKSQVASLSVSKFTDDEMKALVAKPFKKFISTFKGKFRNDIYEFHKKEDDFDWGYDTKMKISDYIQMHYESQNIAHISVICKQIECEILTIEKQEGAWQKILMDINQQPWFIFPSTTISLRTNDENKLSTYTQFSLAPND